MNQENPDQLSDSGLQLDNGAKQHLYETGKWGKFISVIVLTFCLLMLIGGIAGREMIMQLTAKYLPGDLSDMISVGMILIMVLVMIAIVGAVYYFLFNFSVKARKALLTDDEILLNTGLASLKTFFILTTVFATISLLFNILNLF